MKSDVSRWTEWARDSFSLAYRMGESESLNNGLRPSSQSLGIHPELY